MVHSLRCLWRKMQECGSAKSDRNSEQKLPNSDSQNWQENQAAIDNVAAEAWHFYAGRLGDGTDHKVGTISDVGHGTHEHRSQADRREDRRINAGDVRQLTINVQRLSRFEEDEVRRGIVEDAREAAGCPKEVRRRGEAELASLDVQNLQRGLHADKDADEQRGDLNDGAVSKDIGIADLLC